jgi:HEAT repeat protein
MLATRDIGFIPEGSGLEGYARTRDEASYPLRAAMRLAAVAAQRNPARLDLLVRHLDDRSDVLRFWAAQGLLMLGKAAEPALARLERAVASDRSRNVAIVAAEALAGMGKAAVAIPFLARILDGNDNRPIRLQALNALTFVAAPAPARASVARATGDDDIGVRSAARYLLAVIDGTYRPDYPVLDREHFLRSVSSM